ncbi:MAG TPA: DUF2269 family protein [Acidimicrobiales bacterium]|nr:DUF2269 family protein [Acidimicrobiales bacterium]HVC24141.1 DUF2269 family protein [Acidimicrobiales bacterium]
MTGPLYDVVLAAHVLAAVVGFGALGTSGAYAAAVRRSQAPSTDAALTRYFAPGRNWASRAVLLVPLLGGTLLALGHGRDAHYPWPWIGLAIWTGATAVASGVLWPAEREVQRLLCRAPTGDERGALAMAARRTERAAAVTSLAFAAAVVVMVWQPR